MLISVLSAPTDLNLNAPAWTRATLNAEIPLGRLDQCITPNSKHIGV